MKYVAIVDTFDGSALVVDDLGGLLYECDCIEEAQLLACAHNEGAETYEEALVVYPDLLRWVPGEGAPGGE